MRIRAGEQTARTLRIPTLVYSTAEYGAHVRCNSTYTKKLDTQLNSEMRIISGTVKNTPVEWLPVLTNILSPFLRWKDTRYLQPLTMPKR